MKKFSVLMLGLLVLLPLTSCGPKVVEEKVVEFTPSSALEGMKLLKKIHDYTIEIKNTRIGNKGNIYVTNNYYYDSMNSYGYIKEDHDIFKFDVDFKGNLISNEVVLEGDTKLFDSNLFTTFNSFDFAYIKDEEELSITDKNNRMAFLNIMGEDVSTYIDITSLKVNLDIERNILNFKAIFDNEEKYIEASIKNFNKSKSNDVEAFLKSGNAKPYVLSSELKEVRDAFKNDNYTRYVYDDSKNIIGKEYFTKEYYCMNYFSGESLTANTGYVVLIDKAYQGTIIENGTYMFVPGNDETKDISPYLGHTAFKETNLNYIMNYPSNLELFKYFNLFEFNDELAVNFTRDAEVTLDVYKNFGVNNAGFSSVALSGVGYETLKVNDKLVFNVKLYGTFDNTFGVFNFEFKDFGSTKHIGVEKFLSSLTDIK